MRGSREKKEREDCKFNAFNLKTKNKYMAFYGTMMCFARYRMVNRAAEKRIFFTWRDLIRKNQLELAEYKVKQNKTKQNQKFNESASRPDKYLQ